MKSFREIWSRRRFLQKSTESVLAASLAVPIIKRSMWHLHQENVKKNIKPNLDYRVLGRTELKVSIIGYGAMRTMDGYNEIVVGKVMKTRRQDAFIATKILPDLTESNALMESSREEFNISEYRLCRYNSAS